MQLSGLSLYFLCAFFMPFLPFPLSPLHLESTLLGMKDLFFILLGFPRHASLRDRSGVLWTIRNSRFPKFADQNHIRCSYSFLPRFTLESISYSPYIDVYLKNFVTQIRCAARRDNMCLLSPSKKIKWRAFLRSFHRNEFVRKIIIENWITSFPCNINLIELVFASDVLAFLKFSTGIEIFFSEEFRSIM